jgi:hypothetical protein
MSENHQGKILFYSEATGEGIIVTRQMDKIPFVISSWNDFDHLPLMGLHVSFVIENKYAVEIIVNFKQDSNEIENVSLSSIPESPLVTPKGVIDEYFGSVYNNLRPYRHFNDVEHAIDFAILRRFLFTTYNNLLEIDRDLKQSDITDLYRTLLLLSDVYDAFRQKSKHLKQAFRDLFLNRHSEYIGTNNKLEANKDSIGKYDIVIRVSEAAIENFKQVLEKISTTSENYPALQKKFKSTRIKSVDAIHHKREYEEENIQLVQILKVIVDENEEDFKELFIEQAKIFNDKIVLLLNKVAYSFDILLWQKARKSKQIKSYFKKSNIKGQLTSLTYLQYYLQSLNSEKLSNEHRELFNIIPYLQSLQHRRLLYLSIDIDNIMRMKSAISTFNDRLELDTTMEYDTALALIIARVPDFIFVDKEVDFRQLIKMLNELDILEETFIVLVVDNVNEKLLEKAKKIYIQDFLPTKTNSTIYRETIARIVEG